MLTLFLIYKIQKRDYHSEHFFSLQKFYHDHSPSITEDLASKFVTVLETLEEYKSNSSVGSKSPDPVIIIKIDALENYLECCMLSLNSSVEKPRLPEDSYKLVQFSPPISYLGGLFELDPNDAFVLMLSSYNILRAYHLFQDGFKILINDANNDPTIQDLAFLNLLNSCLVRLTSFEDSWKGLLSRLCVFYELCYYAYLLLSNQITHEACKKYLKAQKEFEGNFQASPRSLRSKLNHYLPIIF